MLHFGTFLILVALFKKKWPYEGQILHFLTFVIFQPFWEVAEYLILHLWEKILAKSGSKVTFCNFCDYGSTTAENRVKNGAKVNTFSPPPR